MISDPDLTREARSRLVDELRGQPVSDAKVLDAIGTVPRHEFVGEAQWLHAYENRALPIAEGQTISQPLVVAMMTEVLRLEGHETVLEVGTGSGYQTAVLSGLAARILTLERCESLHASSAARLRRLGYENVTCFLGDGTRGLPTHAPFDAIIVTAGSPSIPLPLREQLAVGGRLVIPVGERRHQTLQCLTRLASGKEQIETVSNVIFVPLVGEYGWPDA